jgi:antirestriction protein ArdC
MNVYDIITSKIVQDITDSSTLPWQRDWTMVWPKNALTQKQYRGINLLLLSLVGKGQWFATFNQIKERGGYIKKGSKAYPICFWKKFDAVKGSDGSTLERSWAMLRYYNVFSLDDVENHGFKLPEVKNVVVDTNLMDVISKHNVDLRHGGNRAYYMPSEHYVQMPNKEQFATNEGYWTTLAHELIHWTGKLVDGKDTVGVGEEYSKEELVAEIGANMLLARLGIDASNVYNNSVAYIRGWASRLGSDTKLVIAAAGQAQKRVDWLLGENKAEQAVTEEAMAA